MVQTSEYIEDSHHQYELASSEAECVCACIYFICKVVYCNKQPFFRNKHANMVCLLNSCLYVMFRSCFESLASVVSIKLVRRALRHTVRTWAVVGKNDWQFSNPRIDTA